MKRSYQRMSTALQVLTQAASHLSQCLNTHVPRLRVTTPRTGAARGKAAVAVASSFGGEPFCGFDRLRTWHV